jgi:mannose-6-phosphate isomerase-like protein (cupin superfamily)
MNLGRCPSSARFNGNETVLEDNQAILVPARKSHKFWNPGDERATIILMMFGESA